MSFTQTWARAVNTDFIIGAKAGMVGVSAYQSLLHIADDRRGGRVLSGRITALRHQWLVTDAVHRPQ